MDILRQFLKQVGPNKPVRWRKKAVNLKRVGLLLVEFQTIVPKINKLDGKFANRVDLFIWHPRVLMQLFGLVFFQLFVGKKMNILKILQRPN